MPLCLLLYYYTSRSMEKFFTNDFALLKKYAAKIC